MKYIPNVPPTKPPGSASVHGGSIYKVPYMCPNQTRRLLRDRITKVISVYTGKSPPSTLQTDAARSISKCPVKCSTRKRQRSLRSLSQRTREWARGNTRAVRRGYFHKVPGCLPTGCFAVFPFVISSSKIPTDLFLGFF